AITALVEASVYAPHHGGSRAGVAGAQLRIIAVCLTLLPLRQPRSDINVGLEPHLSAQFTGTAGAATRCRGPGTGTGPVGTGVCRAGFSASTAQPHQCRCSARLAGPARCGRYPSAVATTGADQRLGYLVVSQLGATTAAVIQPCCISGQRPV